MHEKSSVGPNGDCNCHTSAASGCPFAVLFRWPRFGVRQAAAVLARKVSSGTVRYSLWPPKLRPLGGRRLRAAGKLYKHGRVHKMASVVDGGVCRGCAGVSQVVGGLG